MRSYAATLEVLDVGKVRIPGYLPQETIRVGEITRVTSPFGALSRLYDTSARCGDLFEKPIYLRFRANVVQCTSSYGLSLSIANY